MKKLAWILFASSCLFFSYEPVKYFLANEPIGLLKSKPYDSLMYKTSFFIHITFGGIALLVGWIQFIKKFRNNNLKLHRIIGKIYVAAIFISAPFAFYLGFFAYGGLPTQIGFTFGAVFWITSTYLGYYYIRKKNIKKHKEFIMYSYAGTFAAVTLRIWLPLLMEVTSFKIAYGISVWLSWIPNVIIAYLILNKKEAILQFYKKYKLHYFLKGSLATITLLIMLSYTSAHTWLYKNPSFKGTPLVRTSINENSYFTEEKFIEIEQYLKEESQTTSMMVLENGKVVYEYGDVSEISDIKDAKTSILSMLFGKYIESGTLNLEETIADNNIDEYSKLLPIEKQATIKNLLTSTSGVFYLKNQKHLYTSSPNKKRGSVKPGDYFFINNWDYNVASYILEKKSGNNFHKEVEEQLVIPLGFEDWHIKNQSKNYIKNSKYNAYQIHISTRDMAKIGQLMLQEGNWKGKQLIPKEWVKKSTSSVIPIDTVRVRIGGDISSPLQETYGYLWWGFDRFYDNPDFKGAYTTWDTTGQFITVIPKRNVVVAHKTKLDYLTHIELSDRTKTPSWRYWWILRKLMLNRKMISELASEKSTDEIIEFIKTEYNKDSDYAISERLLNEYGKSLADKGKHHEAIKFFELNLELYPNHGYYTHRIYNLYGNSLLKLNRKEEALGAYKEALKYDADNAEAKKMITQLSN